MLERTRIRKQRQRKRRLRLIAGILAVIATTVLLCGLTHKPQVSGYEYDTASTLWELSERYCPDSMDKRKYIDEIMQLNNMSDSTVYAHKMYMVPVYEK